MQTRYPIDIPIISADTLAGEPTSSNCDGKEIVALNWAYPDTPLAGLESIKGVVAHHAA